MQGHFIFAGRRLPKGWEQLISSPSRKGRAMPFVIVLGNDTHLLWQNSKGLTMHLRGKVVPWLPSCGLIVFCLFVKSNCATIIVEQITLKSKKYGAPVLCFIRNPIVSHLERFKIGKRITSHVFPVGPFYGL